MHVTKNHPNKQLVYLGVLIAMLIALISLQSCKSTKVPNRIYKKLATDAVPLDNEYKKNVMGQKCAVLFPIEIKKIKYDSIIYKNVRVVDNNKITQLQKEVNRLRNLTPNINVDSLYQSYYDSVLNALPECREIEHYNKSEQQGKDTTNNYFRQLNEDALRDTTNKYKAENTSLNKNIEDITKDVNDAKKEKNKWKWRCILACMALVSSWGLYGYFKLRKSLMPKI